MIFTWSVDYGGMLVESQHNFIFLCDIGWASSSYSHHAQWQICGWFLNYLFSWLKRWNVVSCQKIKFQGTVTISISENLLSRFICCSQRHGYFCSVLSLLVKLPASTYTDWNCSSDISLFLFLFLKPKTYFS